MAPNQNLLSLPEMNGMKDIGGQSPRAMLGFRTPGGRKQHFSQANLNEILKSKKRTVQQSPEMTPNNKEREIKRAQEDLDIADSILAAAD